MHRGIVVIGVGLVLAACGDEADDLTWRIRFATPFARDEAERVAVVIRAGACGSVTSLETIYSATLSRDAEPAIPSELEPGTYAFSAEASSARCGSFAYACSTVEIPGEKEAVHEVALELAVTGTGLARCPELGGIVVDASVDARADADADAGVDADAGTLPPVQLRFPWNGLATGSARVPSGGAHHPLRPELRWDPVPTATRYEIELDDSCSSTECALPSPVEAETLSPSYTPDTPLEVSNTAPLGRRYYWRVRACDGERCGMWSEVRYLDVGRESSDLHGDGDADLAIGAHAREVSGLERVGELAVFASAALPGTVIEAPAPEVGGIFANAIAYAGDVDADGFGDLVVGAALQSGDFPRQGFVYLYRGNPSGIEAATPQVLVSPTRREMGSFGIAATGVGDMDGDGYADVLVGAIQGTSGDSAEGAGFLYRGSPSGLLEPPFVIPSPTGEDATDFGITLAGGADIDGDGRCDFAIGARNDDAAALDSGSVRVFRGNASGPPTLMLDLAHPTDAEGARFGNALAMADVDGDGFGDLIVGAPGDSESEGEVFVYLGRTTGLLRNPSMTIVSEAPQEGASFGASVSARGDVDNDGRADVLVGAPGVDGVAVDAGRAYVFLGSSDIRTPIASLFPPEVATGQLGFTVSIAGDVNSDGGDDVLVGSPGVDANGGAAFMFLGGITFDTTIDATYRDPAGVQPESLFGWSLAR